MINTMLVIAILFAVLYIVVELTQKPLIALVFKALASLAFIALGLTRLLDGYQVFQQVMGWMILGLVSGLIGDILLALRPLRPKEEDKLIILFGIIAFSIGHIFYLIGLNIIEPFFILSFGFGFVVACVVLLGSIVFKFKMGIARYPSYFYAFLIFTMIFQSFILRTTYPSQSAYTLFMMGAILFGVSDLILAPIYFAGNTKKLMVSLNLITYYGAQILIALSLFYI